MREEKKTGEIAAGGGVCTAAAGGGGGWHQLLLIASWRSDADLRSYPRCSLSFSRILVVSRRHP